MGFKKTPVLAKDNGKVKMTITMTGTWKQSLYGYLVTVEDDKGVVRLDKDDRRGSNSIVISGLPKGPRYTVKVTPYLETSNGSRAVWRGGSYEQKNLPSPK